MSVIQPPYPLVNGVRYGFASIKLAIAGMTFVGFKEISYSQEVEEGEVRGAHPEVLGTTQGELKNEASATVFMEEWGVLLNKLGDGYMDKRFDVTILYATNENITQIQKDELKGVRITKVEKSGSQGSDAPEVKLTFSVLETVMNGKKALNNPLVQLRLG